MSREQRWAAAGVVVALAAVWAALAVSVVVDPYVRDGPPNDDGRMLVLWFAGVVALLLALVWLGAGLVTVRRRAEGRWRWWPAAASSVLAALLSVLAAAALGWSGPNAEAAVLLTLQALALLAWAGLLWTPGPVGGGPPTAA